MFRTVLLTALLLPTTAFAFPFEIPNPTLLYNFTTTTSDGIGSLDLALDSNWNWEYNLFVPNFRRQGGFGDASDLMFQMKDTMTYVIFESPYGGLNLEVFFAASGIGWFDSWDELGSGPSGTLAFASVPMPEPNSLLLLSLGFLLLFGGLNETLRIHSLHNSTLRNTGTSSRP